MLKHLMRDWFPAVTSPLPTRRNPPGATGEGSRTCAPPALTTVRARTLFAPLDEGGRAETVARRLAKAIRLGLLLDGERLPAESHLAGQFGVSTVTLREALASLRQMGLVETRRGRRGGSFVRAPDDPQSARLESARCTCCPSMNCGTSAITVRRSRARRPSSPRARAPARRGRAAGVRRTAARRSDPDRAAPRRRPDPHRDRRGGAVPPPHPGGDGPVVRGGRPGLAAGARRRGSGDRRRARGAGRCHRAPRRRSRPAGPPSSTCWPRPGA